MTQPIYSPSQTIGPFFHNGLKWADSNRMGSLTGGKRATLFGKVFDGDGQPVADAMLEFWAPQFRDGFNEQHRSNGFARVPTDKDGIYRLQFPTPTANKQGDQLFEAHLNLMVFARGLLTPVFTRVYFAHDIGSIADDPVIKAIGDPIRASRLLAKETKAGVFEWDVHLQGDHETVFLTRE